MGLSTATRGQKNPERVARGRAAIATARERGKYGPALALTCPICGGSYSVPPSKAAKARRCTRCIKNGRALCAACGGPIDVAPGSGGHPLCEECKATERRGPTLRPRAERVPVPCVGAKLPRRLGGGRRHAKGCKGTRLISPSQDPDEYRMCKPCSTLGKRWVPEKLGLVEKLGYRPRTYEELLGFVRDMKDNRAPGQHPAFKARQGHPAEMIAARRAGSGGLSGPARSRLQMVTTWAKGENGWKIRQCRVCSRLLMISTAPTARSVELHEPCRAAWRSSLDGQKWATRPRAQRAVRPRIPKRPGKHRSPETLTMQFRWTVLALLGGFSHTEIAERYGVDRSHVSRSVGEILELLPNPDVCDRRFRRYVEALRGTSISRTMPARPPRRGAA